MPIEPLLNEYQTEKITARKVASLRRDRLLGRGIPYVKLMGLVRYRPSDIRRFIEQNVRGSLEGK